MRSFIEKLTSCPLEDATAYLKHVLGTAQTGSWAWDLVTGEIFWSEELNLLLGISPPVLRPSSEECQERAHPEDRGAVLEQARTAIRERREINSEFRIVRPDGTVRWVCSQGKTLCDAAGEPLRIIGVTFDITERRQAEEDLRRREEEMRIVTDGVPALISYIDAQETYQFNNVKYEMWFGHPRTSIRGKHVREVLGEAAYQEILPHIRSALAGQEVLFHTCVEYKGAGPRWVEARYVPRFDQEGRVLGFFAMVTDVTEQKQTEQLLQSQAKDLRETINDLRRLEADLRESEERLRLATEAAAIGVWSWDIQTGEVYWTPECHKIMGVEDFMGRLEDFTRQVHPQDVDQVWSAVQEAIGQRKPYWSEFRIVQADGKIRWLLNHGRVEHDETGRASRLLGIVADITQRKRAEEALQEADRRKDEFLAMLAHELRNPLAPIHNAVQVMRQLDPQDARMDRMRDVIERQATQLTRLVDDLLDLSRISQGKITLLQEPLDLSVVIARAVEMSRPLVDAGGHCLSVSLFSAPVRIQGDIARLTQVVSNLLNNASRYTPPGGNIRLETVRREDFVEIHVQDDGIGIAPENLSRVFDLFTQADQARDHAQGGLGIGLTLVKRIVELHGGTVEAFSAGVGRGSDFSVRLPALVEAPAADTADLTGNLPETFPVPYRILVVDDDRDTAESLALLLSLGGLDVRTAYDGTTALETARTFRPQVVLLDLGLPQMDGFEVASRLREQKEHPMVFFALTGYGQSADRRRSRDAGFDHHLVKPIEYDELKRLIHSLELA
jgi:PAS domain S-box-containing protein